MKAFFVKQLDKVLELVIGHDTYWQFSLSVSPGDDQFRTKSKRQHQVEDEKTIFLKKKTQQQSCAEEQSQQSLDDQIIGDRNFLPLIGR